MKGPSCIVIKLIFIGMDGIEEKWASCGKFKFIHLLPRYDVSIWFKQRKKIILGEGIFMVSTPFGRQVKRRLEWYSLDRVTEKCWTFGHFKYLVYFFPYFSLITCTFLISKMTFNLLQLKEKIKNNAILLYAWIKLLKNVLDRS